MSSSTTCAFTQSPPNDMLITLKHLQIARRELSRLFYLPLSEVEEEENSPMTTEDAPVKPPATALYAFSHVSPWGVIDSSGIQLTETSV